MKKIIHVIGLYSDRARLEESKFLHLLEEYKYDEIRHWPLLDYPVEADIEIKKEYDEYNSADYTFNRILKSKGWLLRTRKINILLPSFEGLSAEFVFRLKFLCEKKKFSLFTLMRAEIEDRKPNNDEEIGYRKLDLLTTEDSDNSYLKTKFKNYWDELNYVFANSTIQIVTALVFLGYMAVVLIRNFSETASFGTIFYSRLNGNELWIFFEPIVTILLLILGVFVWYNEQKASYYKSLPMKFNTFYVFENKIVSAYFNKTLAHAGDIRNFGYSAFQIISNGRGDFRAFFEISKPKFCWIEGYRTKVYSLILYLNAMPKEAEYANGKNEKLRTYMEKVNAGQVIIYDALKF